MLLLDTNVLIYASDDDVLSPIRDAKCMDTHTRIKSTGQRKYR